MIPYYILPTINIGFLTFHVWGLFAGLAFAAALVFALKEAKRKNISEDTVFDLAILILIGGVVGARMAYVLENWAYFSQNKDEILGFKDGGLMFLGGALFVLLLIGVYLRIKKLNGWVILDSFVPSFAIGEFIGRIGCELTDLHIGSLSSLPWAQEHIDGSLRHPVSIYMSLNGLLMLIIFWGLRTKIKFEGALFLLFVLWYSGIRFLLDYLRCGDLDVCDPHYSGFTPSQYISAAVFIISFIYLINILKNSPTGFARILAARIGVIKHMEEKKNEDAVKQAEQSIENKNLQDSVITYTKVEEVIFDSNTDHTSNDSADLIFKDKIIELLKKPLVMTAALIVFLGIGVAAASVYYNSVFYGEMFKKSPFSFKGKTWISFDEPIIGLKIVNDKNCAACDTSEIISQIKGGVMPTLSESEIDFDSEEGKKLIASFNIKSVPALVFDSSIEKSTIFEKIKTVLENKEGLYYLSSAESGIPPGRFLTLPLISSEDRIKGSGTAPVTIIEFSDFQCPYCKEENNIINQLLIDYPDKVRLVYKHLPLPTHANAQYAAEAAECAGDQGKFFEFADVLFANQDKLDAISIAKYAKDLKLDAKVFKDCTDSGKFKNKVTNDAKTAVEFGVGGTPAFFVGDQFFGGAVALDDFKTVVDSQIKK